MAFSQDLNKDQSKPWETGGGTNSTQALEQDTVDVCKEGTKATVAGAEEHRLAVSQQ